MALFWEEQMSSSNTVARGERATCSTGGVAPHATQNVNPGPDGQFGTADDVRGSVGVPASDSSGRYTGSASFGIRPQVTTRKAPSVINAAYQPTLFYDGRATNGSFADPVSNIVILTGDVALENLIKGPPVNEVEMGHVGRSWPEVAAKIAQARPLALASNLPPRLSAFVGTASTYNELFVAAFGANASATPANIIMAIAADPRTRGLSTRSVRPDPAGQGTLTAAELNGLQLFFEPARHRRGLHAVPRGPADDVALVRSVADVLDAVWRPERAELAQRGRAPGGRGYRRRRHHAGARRHGAVPGLRVCATRRCMASGSTMAPWPHSTTSLRSTTAVATSIRTRRRRSSRVVSATQRGDIVKFLQTLTTGASPRNRCRSIGRDLAAKPGLLRSVSGTGSSLHWWTRS